MQANENKTLLTDVLTEGSSISVYGGYVAPTTATVLTPVQEDDEWVLQARENASANENILQIVQTVDKDASYKDVLGGTTLYGEANGNQVIIQGTEKEKSQQLMLPADTPAVPMQTAIQSLWPMLKSQAALSTGQRFSPRRKRFMVMTTMAM